MDQLVSKELAIKAMEIGFDEWCERSYMKDSKDSLSIDGRNSTLGKLEIDTFSAPTQTQLAKWLRVKHQIHVYVIPSIIGWEWRIMNSSTGNFLCDFNDDETDVFFGPNYNFENAFDAGLFKSCGIVKLRIKEH